MIKSESETINFVLRRVKEMHETVKQRLNGLFQVLPTDNHEEKVKANKLLLEACTDLSNLLSEADRPSWLVQLLAETDAYSSQHKSSGVNFRLLDKIVSQRNDAIKHQWSFDKPGLEADFNFDHVYEKFKKDRKLTKYFDALLDALEKIINSKEIDSSAVLNGLEQLLLLIKQNKSGSYFAVFATSEFILKFTKNFLWQGLDNLPGVKEAKTAFEETAKEMNIDIKEMQNVMEIDVNEKYKTTVLALSPKHMNGKLLEHKSDEK